MRFALTDTGYKLHLLRPEDHWMWGRRTFCGRIPVKMWARPRPTVEHPPCQTCARFAA